MSASNPWDQSQPQGPPQMQQQQQMYGETVVMSQPVQGSNQAQPEQQVQMQQMPQMMPQGQQMQQMMPQGQQMQMMPNGQQMIPQGQPGAGPVQIIYVQAPQQTAAVVDTTNYNSCGVGSPPPVMFNTLGPGKLCEIGGCGKQAYMICGKDKGFYQGGIGCCCDKVKQCGRMCCENHIEVLYGKHDRVQFYCCKEPGQSTCRKSYRNHHSVVVGLFLIIFCVFFFGSIVQSAINPQRQSGYNNGYNSYYDKYNNNSTMSSYNKTSSTYGDSAAPPGNQNDDCSIKESQNKLGPNVCTKATECVGKRTCSTFGLCTGTSGC